MNTQINEKKKSTKLKIPSSNPVPIFFFLLGMLTGVIASFIAILIALQFE